MRRRLTVILASDVAGYSRLVAADEEDTVHRFKRAAGVFTDFVSKHQGRVFNTAGDAILAEFESAVDAARCAIDIQDANNAQNATVADDKKLLFRIGIAIGDVMVAENGDLLGDGVNIAARLEGVAEPGGICISEDVRVHVLNKIRFNMVDLGEQSLRNIPRPIRAFRLLPNTAAPIAPAGRRRWLAGAGISRRLALTLPVLLIVAAAAGVGYFRMVSPGASSGRAQPSRPFNVTEVPLVSDRVRDNLANFNQLPNFKAIAISHIGWGVSSGAPDLASAEREALDRCKRRDQQGECRTYALGSNVVLPQLPMPLPADLHASPLEVPLTAADVAGIRGVPTAAGIDTFLKAKDHKALAVSAAAFSSMVDRPGREEAIRLAVERCSDAARAACLLLSVDGFLTVSIPHTYRALRPYTVAGDPDMTDADRQQIAPIYARKDWRALVRGASNRWYAVADAGSETDAVDQVLKACHAAETDCALRAVGNFRVEDKR